MPVVMPLAVLNEDVSWLIISIQRTGKGVVHEDAMMLMFRP
jgi:hypothetical protein